MSAVLSVRASTSRPPRAALSRAVGVLLVVLSCSGVLAAPAAADPRPHRLTTAQERVVLRLIDDVCGDTWCEGDHAFRFTRFSCSSTRRGCLLVVRIAPWSEGPLQWQRRSYPVRGFLRYSDMVSTGPEGSRALQPAFYEAVGHAVLTMAASVPRSAGLRSPGPGQLVEPVPRSH